MTRRILLGIGIFTASLWLLTGLVMADHVPRPQGFVNDYANVLGVTEHLKLERELRNFKQREKKVITVVTVNDLRGEDLTTYAVKLSQDWKVQSQPDHPVIVAIDTVHNKAVINRGFGLEGMAPDPVIKSILSNNLYPRLYANDYYGALRAAVLALEPEEVHRTEELRSLHAALIVDPKSAAAIRLFLGLSGLPGVYIAAYMARRGHQVAGAIVGLLVGMLLGAAYSGNDIWAWLGLVGGVYGLTLDIGLKYAWQMPRTRLIYKNWWTSWGGWRGLLAKRLIIPVHSSSE